MPPKKVKSAPAASRVQKRKGAAPVKADTKRLKVSLNSIPDQRLDVLGFGSNAFGELGLGDATKKSEFKVPVLNPKLSAEDVGVVHVAVGGVHAAALTHDNRILTWGVNDDGALGRDTTDDAPLTAIDADDKNEDADESGSDDSEDSDDEIDFNLKESTPTEVDSAHIAPGTAFCQLALTDCATFALTSTGLVYGWGRFRNSNGTIGFSAQILGDEIQKQPIQIRGLEKVTKLAAGAQHVLALTSSGKVYTWGCPEHQVLGRQRLSPRRAQAPEKHMHLVPGVIGLSNIIDIAAGQFHSFVIRKDGRVFSWGSNNFGQTGISAGAGGNSAITGEPTPVLSLQRYIRNSKGTSKIVRIEGGKDHSLAVTDGGECLAWGRIENKALGLDIDSLPDSKVILNERGKKAILTIPIAIPRDTFDGNVVSTGIGTDTSIAITDTGKAYGWGWNQQFQAGMANVDDKPEIEVPTLLDSKHVQGRTILSAGLGGQFGILTGTDGNLSCTSAASKKR